MRELRKRGGKKRYCQRLEIEAGQYVTLTDDDFVVCGYIYKENNMISIVLGKYRDGLLTYQSHVTLGAGGVAFARIKAQPRAICPPFDVPEGHGNEDAVWIEPRLVCVVEYMHKTRSGGMRQPVFKGLRDDKRAEECQVSE